MNIDSSFRCYICYGKTMNEEYHSACLRKLFNTEQLPDINFSNQDIASMALEYIKERRGLPGVQKKISLSLETFKKERGIGSRLTLIGYLGGEYILKPPSVDYPYMPEIEHLTMHLAEIAKIIVPPHGLIKMTSGELAYIIKRFDRQGKKKIAVEDLCQLSSKMTEDKYKSSSENVGKILRKYSKNPGEDLLKFFELILFSFLVGNADMHLKNFSLLTEQPDNIKFSPCYDLLATKLLIPTHIDPEELALPINGKKSNLRKKDFLAFAENLKILPKVANYSMESMRSCFSVWENKINQSFLSQKLKESFKELIAKNSHRLD